MFEGLFAVAPWMAYVLVVVGFVPLVKGADWLVDGGSALAARFKIPTLVIGLTIVAFGTSSPEMVVNVVAATGGNTDIALGNIIGSNIFNVLGILGLTALISPLVVKNSTTWVEIPLTLVSAVAVAILANDLLLNPTSPTGITAWAGIGRGDGLILLLFFAIFLGYTIYLSISNTETQDLEIKPWGRLQSVGFILLGLAALVVGGKVIVDSAVQVAQSWGLSERIIGLTIVSIGTSLPELATSLVAARKGNPDIAIGNIVGSNIFNAFFILGVSALIAPLPFTPASQFDLMVNIVTTLILMFFVFFPKGRKISRSEGLIMLLAYVAYVVALIVM